MGRPKGSFSKKDKFEALLPEFKDAIQQSSTEEIRKKISDVAILDCTMKATLKEDPEVQGARETLKNLMEPYREDLKSYKLQIEFMKRTLDDKGGGMTVTARVGSDSTTN